MLAVSRISNGSMEIALIGGWWNYRKKGRKERMNLAEVLSSKIIDLLLHLHPRQCKKEAEHVKENHLVKSFVEL